MSEQYHSARFPEAKEIFLMVCDLDLDSRRQFLNDRCADSAALRQEVESLLEYYDGNSGETSAGLPGGQEPTVQPARRTSNGDLRQIGPYRIVRELGSGGMGVVYLAMREGDHFRQRVAIKVLKRGMDTDDILRRFDLERQVLAALNHANIARLYDAGETDDGRPYFVMEYIEGLPIDRYCDDHRLRIAERLELFKAVCSAVHHAHQNLVIHRDLKPANIIVTEDGVAKLLDFGIAKIINPELSLVTGDPTAPEFRVMTPQYASPEQVRGGPITTASDIYSLGVLLYELVSGHRPYQLKSRVRAEIERIICEEDPQRPSTAVSRVEEIAGDTPAEATPVPDFQRPPSTVTPESVSRTREGRPERLRRRLEGDIDTIVLMAMRKESQRRYRSAEQLAEDIDRHLKGLPVMARGDTLPYRMAKFVQRHRAGTAAAVLLVVSLLAGTAGTASGWRAERAQRAVAEAQRDRADELIRHGIGLSHVFLFELHDEIQKLDSSLPARETLVETARGYLEGLQQFAGDDPVLLREVADSYDRVGDIRGGIRTPSHGNLTDAMEFYQRSLDLRRGLLEASPRSRELRSAVATSRLKVGDILRRSGRTAEALEAYREVLELQETLAREEPGAQRQRALYIALQNVGTVLTATGDQTGALEHYERSLQLRRDVLRSDPGNELYQRDVSSGHLRLGGQLWRLGRGEEGMGEYEEALKIRRRLFETAGPDDARARRDFAVALQFAGEGFIDLGRPEQGRGPLEEFHALAEEAAAKNPLDERARRDLAAALELRGRGAAALDRWDEAMGFYERGRDVIEPLRDKERSNTNYASLLGSCWTGIGEASAATGEWSGAIRSYDEARRILEQVVSRDSDNDRWRIQHAKVSRLRGVALLERGRIDEARSELEAARQEYETIARQQPGHAEVQAGLDATKQALSRIGPGPPDHDP